MGNAEGHDVKPITSDDRKELNLSRNISYKQFIKVMFNVVGKERTKKKENESRCATDLKFCVSYFRVEAPEPVPAPSTLEATRDAQAKKWVQSYLCT